MQWEPSIIRCKSKGQCGSAAAGKRIKQVIMTNSVAVERGSEGMIFPDEFLLNKDLGGLSRESFFMGTNNI
jgi:hypothetical protein